MGLIETDIKANDEHKFIYSKTLLMMHRTTPLTPYTMYQTAQWLSDITFIATSLPYQSNMPNNMEPAMIQYELDTLHLISMLCFTDKFSYTGKEFMIQKVEQCKMFLCQLGDEEFELELLLFAPAYGSKYERMATDMSSYIFQPCNTNYDHRINDWRKYPPTCTVHAFHVMDNDDLQFWEDLK